MNVRRAALLLAAVACAASRAPAQAASMKALAIPQTEGAIAAWDIAIVKRAAQLIAAPERWNRGPGSDECAKDAKAFSLRCALERAIDEAAGRVSSDAEASGRPKPCPPACTGASPANAACELRESVGLTQGSCGEFFDESTVFVIERVPSITSGVWRKDARPGEVWAGRMTNAENPVLDEARKLVNEIARKPYREGRLAGYNDDSTTTFADVQQFLRLLQGRLSGLPLSQMTSSADSVEIEIYAGGTGVIRTYNGWYAVSAFSAPGSTVRFQVDTSKQIPANGLDREIIRRADAILSSDAVWNRADNRKCPAAATTWSIYCAMERATREVTGGFHHRRPAQELVRLVVEDRTKGRKYNHRLMDYNNDKTTTLADVRSIFAEALSKVPSNP